MDIYLYPFNNNFFINTFFHSFSIDEEFCIWLFMFLRFFKIVDKELVGIPNFSTISFCLTPLLLQTSFKISYLSAIHRHLRFDIF